MLADRAKKLAAEAGEAAKRGDTATASLKASQAADAVSKGLTAPDPPAKPQSFGEIIAHLSTLTKLRIVGRGLW